MATTSIADFGGRDNVSLAPGIRSAEASDFRASLCPFLRFNACLSDPAQYG
jgi:hypothetical protein